MSPTGLLTWHAVVVALAFAARLTGAVDWSAADKVLEDAIASGVFPGATAVGACTVAGRGAVQQVIAGWGALRSLGPLRCAVQRCKGLVHVR